MLGLDKISKNTNIYNTYFGKELEYENEKLHKEAEDDVNLGANKLLSTKEYTDKIIDKLKTGVGCSVRISGLRRMEQWYYEWKSSDNDDIKKNIVNLWLVWAKEWQLESVEQDSKVLRKGYIVCYWGHYTRIQNRLIIPGVTYSKKLVRNDSIKMCKFHDVKVEMDKSKFEFNYMHRWYYQW
jgi:hypothetical protein